MLPAQKKSGITAIAIIGIGVIVFMWLASINGANNNNSSISTAGSGASVTPAAQASSTDQNNSSYTPVAIADIPAIAQTINTSTMMEAVELDGAVIKIWPDNEFEIQDSSGSVALIQVNGQEADDASFMSGLVIGDKVAVDTAIFSSRTVGMTIGWSLDNNTEPTRTFPLAFFQLPKTTIYTEAPPDEITVTYAVPEQELSPSSQPTWHVAFSYSGGDTKEDSKPFFMQGEEWRVTLACPESDSGVFELFFSANNYGVTDLTIPQAIFFNNYPFTDCPGTDVVEEHEQSPGYYTLDIYPPGNYTVTVEDYY